MRDRLYTTNQLAREFGVVPTTVIDWIERGKLQAFKTLGGHRRITHDAVLQFLRLHQLPAPPAFAQRAARVLVLDGDPENLRSLAEIIQRALPDAVLFLESHPVDALLRIGAERPQLAVFDVAMPGLDGVEFCRRLRAWFQPQQLKLLALAAEINDTTEARVLEAGADQLLAKNRAEAELAERSKQLLAALPAQEP